ncbi:MAG: hypothetical protein LBF00_03110 [Mycoplasmataceae bacterium]|nr:hypothetical protein [Mycoplasmataceae bacterium]
MLKPKNGLTREELQREINHYHKLLDNDSLDSKNVEQIKFMLVKYENWMANFDNLDMNKDGRLDTSETNGK